MYACGACFLLLDAVLSESDVTTGCLTKALYPNPSPGRFTTDGARVSL